MLTHKSAICHFCGSAGPGQIGRWLHNALNLSVCLFVRLLPNCEYTKLYLPSKAATIKNKQKKEKEGK